MTTQTEKTISGAGRFMDDLNGAVRENPVSAGLVGLGLLWMFVGSTKIAAIATALPEKAKQIATAVGDTSKAATAASSDGIEQVIGAAHQAGDVVTESANAVGARIASAGQSASTASVEFGQQVGRAIQTNMSATVERQPLLLGVLGVGIGAAIATMFSSTKAEQDLMGEAGAVVKSGLEGMAGQTAQLAEEVFEDVKDEAASQGLTTAAAGEGFKSVVEKVKTTADAGKESILNRLSIH